jgi:hypothetical protein
MFTKTKARGDLTLRKILNSKRFKKSLYSLIFWNSWGLHLSLDNVSLKILLVIPYDSLYFILSLTSKLNDHIKSINWKFYSFQIIPLNID